jgi:hypothetical protein
MSEKHKSVIPTMVITVEVTGKDQLWPGQESIGNSAVLLHCTLLRNP